MGETKKRLPRVFSLGKKQQHDPEDGVAEAPRSTEPPLPRLTATLDDVLEKIRAHSSGISPKDKDGAATVEHPKFDSLVQYNVTEDQEDRLWQIEAARLIAAVEDLSSELKFNSRGTRQTDMPYQQIGAVAEKILLYLHICTLDNELEVLKSPCQDLKSMNSLTASEQAVQKWLDDEDDLRAAIAKKLSLKENKDKDGVVDDTVSTADMITYVAAVDYITVVLARFAVISGEHPSWQKRAIGGLAKCAAKLKILIRRPKVYATNSLNASRLFIAEQKGEEVFNASVDSIEQYMADRGRPRYHYHDHNSQGNMNMNQGDQNMNGGDGNGGGEASSSEKKEQQAANLAAKAAKEAEIGLEWYKKEIATLAKPRTHSDFYFSDMALMFRWTSGIMTSLLSPLTVDTSIDPFKRDKLLVPLKKDSKFSSPPRMFDISTTTYRAGLGDSIFSVYMHQDQRHELHGCSRHDFIPHSYAGFSLTRQAIRGIQHSQAVRDNSLSKKSEPRVIDLKAKGGLNTGMIRREEETFLMFRMEHASDDENLNALKVPDDIQPVPLQTLRLTTAAEIFAAIIPVICTSSTAILQMQYYLFKFGELHNISVDERLTPPPLAHGFTGTVSLYTQAFREKSQTALPDDTIDYDSLSRSVLAHPDRQLEHRKIPTGTAAWSPGSGFTLLERGDAARNVILDEVKLGRAEIDRRRERLAQEVRSWDIEQYTIGVKCTRYVYSVLAFAAFLVAGGLAAAFTLGEAVQGVDPFGIANFSWLLAAFWILVAKSVRVTEWPWRDFLFGRVTCRSLSELRAVTGTNEQDLILCLLAHEHETMLVTRGPYNQMFTRKEERGSGAAFSIDVKPQLRTLVSAGFIFLKVAKLAVGPMNKSAKDVESTIEVFDLRVAQDSEVMSVLRFSEKERAYICRKPPKKGDRNQDIVLDRVFVSENNMLLFGKQAFVRAGILGIYRNVEKAVR